MLRIASGAVTILAVLLGAVSASAAETAPSPGSLSELAARLVRAYHSGDIEALRPRLAPGLVFEDPGLKQRLELAGFLELVGKMGTGERDRELEIVWTGVAGDRADVRGAWRWTDVESGRENELRFSIELEFETAGDGPRIVGWRDDFRRRMWKPATGDSRLETEHFAVSYLASELSAEEAARLGETLEHWYGKTREFLGRSFADGYRLQINVAGGHESPFASDPGPEAFILVPAHQAKLEYGFSLVHELTHNLLGLSWLSRHEFERNGVRLFSGNRLFDEGFAVYVEEKLTGEGPAVWPNWEVETHAAYWQLREQQGEPIWPVLEAEIHRERGDARLGYLAQGSFCKYLVETHGLDRFLRLFAGDPAAAPEIYGRDLAGLERGWRTFLEERFGGRPAAESGSGSV